MKKKETIKALAAVLLVTALGCLLGPGLLYILKNQGFEICSGARASQYPGRILLQWTMLMVYPAVLLLVMKKRLGKGFLKAMGLEVRWRIQWILAALLGLVLTVMAGVAARRTGDPVLVLLNLFYYLAAVAFCEEFLFRAVCPYLLRGLPWQVVYLLPSLLFALSHIFAYNGFHALTGAAVWYFLSSQLLGLMASGCCFQVLKDWSGTLWVPILLHAILDFSAVFLM